MWMRQSQVQMSVSLSMYVCVCDCVLVVCVCCLQIRLCERSAFCARIAVERNKMQHYSFGHAVGHWLCPQTPPSSPPMLGHLALNATYYLTDHNVDGTRTYTCIHTYILTCAMFARDGKGVCVCVWTGKGRNVSETANGNRTGNCIHGRHLDKLKRVIKCSSFYL